MGFGDKIASSGSLILRRTRLLGVEIGPLNISTRSKRLSGILEIIPLK
jgi:hypothetical protein